MCHSAQIEADYKRFVHEYGAIMSLDDFTRMVVEYFDNPKMRVPKAMTAPFLESPETDEERKIAEVIQARKAAEELALLQELGKQTERLEKAQQALAVQVTKKAAEDVRIATSKIAAIKGKLEELKSTELTPRDSRIFPGWYAPVMVMENGRRVVKPMRYQCRQACVLRHRVSGHVQRATGQFARFLEGAVRPYAWPDPGRAFGPNHHRRSHRYSPHRKRRH
ncbi:hypothetical protein [Ralstonia chuxiongensis]|uniref:hypothetical protein n=1 Tax=Ralstonia chuxiongensis TaxID=2957504 RepID=UPI0028F6288A|nr:hypothetical protein [Ralstonia chuxiongensis]CAJ0785449.1 hypothetical protein R8510_05390 [Ralstonia chuxiongensis]